MKNEIEKYEEEIVIEPQRGESQEFVELYTELVKGTDKKIANAILGFHQAICRANKKWEDNEMLPLASREYLVKSINSYLKLFLTPYDFEDYAMEINCFGKIVKKEREVK